MKYGETVGVAERERKRECVLMLKKERKSEEREREREVVKEKRQCELGRKKHPLEGCNVIENNAALHNCSDLNLKTPCVFT